MSPRSSKLSPCDFVWVHLKAQVYIHHFRSLVELTQTIQEEVAVAKLNSCLRRPTWTAVL